jgi:hypothetical protein
MAQAPFTSDAGVLGTEEPHIITDRSPIWRANNTVISQNEDVRHENDQRTERQESANK